MRETKKGWNTFSEVGFETPSPDASDKAKALAIQLVIVSGTFAIITVFPVSPLLTNDKNTINIIFTVVDKIAEPIKANAQNANHFDHKII